MHPAFAPFEAIVQAKLVAMSEDPWKPRVQLIFVRLDMLGQELRGICLVQNIERQKKDF